MELPCLCYKVVFESYIKWSPVTDDMNLVEYLNSGNYGIAVFYSAIRLILVCILK